MLTRKSKYGLKALLVLAREYQRGPLLASELSAREGIPQKFLQGILLELKRRGIIRSKRGQGGGYELAREPASVSFGEVIRILEGPLALTPCVSQTAYQRCEECADEWTCGVRLVMKSVRDETARILEGSTLAVVNRAVDRLPNTGLRSRATKTRSTIRPTDTGATARATKTGSSSRATKGPRGTPRG